jgi:hypothetical protein
MLPQSNKYGSSQFRRALMTLLLAHNADNYSHYVTYPSVPLSNVIITIVCIIHTRQRCQL